MKQHSKYWRCPSHRDFGTFSSREDYIEHMRATHKTTLSDIQLSALANRNSRTTSKQFPICPLCGEDEIHGQMESHITGHLRSLALKSLPSYEEAIPDDVANNNDSVSASRQKSRSTIKEFMDIKETLELEQDGSYLVEQANQSSTKSFLGDANSDLERQASHEEWWDASCFKELAFHRTYWDPGDDYVFQSFLLEKRKQDTLMQSVPRRGEMEPRGVKGAKDQNLEQVEPLVNDSAPKFRIQERGKEAECRTAADLGSSGMHEVGGTVESKLEAHLGPEPKPHSGASGFRPPTTQLGSTHSM